MSVDQYQRTVNGLDKEIADLEKKKAAKEVPTVGNVVPLADFIRGEVKSTKDVVNKEVEKGNPIVLVSGKGKAAKAYILIGQSGSYSGQYLAKYAAYDEVSVYGKKYSTGGISYIIFSEVVGK